MALDLYRRVIQLAEDTLYYDDDQDGFEQRLKDTIDVTILQIKQGDADLYEAMRPEAREWMER